MRINYLQKLKMVGQEILLLGEMVAQALQNTVSALVRDDKEAAHALIDADETINNKRFYIEEQLVQLIAKEQPMAKDLRNIVAHLIVTTELERTADYAVGIARNAYKMENKPPEVVIKMIEDMSAVVISMLNSGVQAYLSGNIVNASIIGKQDDDVDEHYHKVSKTLLQMIADNEIQLADAMRLMWTAHNLERGADRTTNICERTIYVQTGLMKEFEHGLFS